MKKYKKILRIFLWIAVSTGTLTLSAFISETLDSEKCKAVLIEIDDKEQFGFISEEEVLDILNSEFNTPLSSRVGEIRTDEIEKRLREHSYTDNVMVFLTIDGKLIVRLKQRQPILRVFSSNGSFYIDKKGKVMPVSDKFTAHVPVATGQIRLNHNKLMALTNSRKTDSTQLPKLYKDLCIISNYLDSHPFWKAQIEQLYVNKQSEFELIPRVGNHTIVLGEVYDLDVKLEKLMLFYKEGLSKTGWNEYKTINLKFKDQVVCTKRF